MEQLLHFLSDALFMFGLGLLIMHLLTVKTGTGASGLSSMSLQALAIYGVVSLFGRGKSVFHLFTCVLCSTACVLFYSRHYGQRSNYNPKSDSFGRAWMARLLNVPVYGSASTGFVILSALCCALILHLMRRLERGVSFFQSYSECFADCLFALFLLPQIHLIRIERVIPWGVSNFLLAIWASRVLEFADDVVYDVRYEGMNPTRGIDMFADVVNIVLCVDIVYFILKAKLSGIAIVVIPVGLSSASSGAGSQMSTVSSSPTQADDRMV